MTDFLASTSVIVAPSGSREVAPARAERSPVAMRPVRARYDSAKTTSENARTWADADGLSARTANSRGVRDLLRRRARHEVANNSLAYGIIDTYANDVIGTGPRLTLSGGGDAERAIELSFAAWMQATGLDDKLRTMTKSKVVDGEAFALLTTNPRLNHPVQLDVKLIEADQIATPWLNPIDPLRVDGIHYDVHGNPIQYDMLRSHPGDFYQLGLIADAIDASRMIHWFKADRPGQCRGVPEITPALALYPQLRRYTLAVLAAAETAADFAAVMYSELPPEAGVQDGDPFETLEIDRRLMMTLPAGWKMGQFKAEQPSTTYPMFKQELLNEMARCLNMPYNIAACNSSGYNYSSGRLDHQTYYKSIGVVEWSCERTVLCRIFDAWIEEAWLATDLIPDGPQRLAGWPHQWMWDGQGHIDPLKDANAEKTRLESRTTSYARVYARQGLDWKAELKQIAEEQELMAELGISPSPPAPGAQPPGQPANQPSYQDGGSDAEED